MAKISTISTGTPASTSRLVGNIGSTTYTWDIQDMPGVLPSTAGTSGQLLQTTGAAATWVGMTANTLLYGNSSGEVTELAAGTSGQKLVAAPTPTWIDDDWGVTILIDGGGLQITTGIKAVIRMPWAAGVEGMEIVATTGNVSSGNFITDVYVDDFSSTPASSGSKITADDPPTISSGSQRSSGITSSWTTAIVAGDYLTFDVISDSSDVTLVALSMWGKKLSTG